MRMSPFIEVEEGIAARHPVQLLELLWKVLPEDPWLWPYETRRILDALSERDEVREDQRLAELIRREQNR